MVLRNQGIDCRKDRTKGLIQIWEVAEQEWKKEKELFLSELLLVIDLSKHNFFFFFFFLSGGDQTHGLAYTKHMLCH
jgi:hypothetical protein